MSCKNCRFYNFTSRRCALTRCVRSAWDCCPSHEEKPK